MKSPDFDRRVRQHIYEATLARGHPPTVGETAKGLSAPVYEILASFQRLAAAHILVLQPENGEILMASPFSAVPTPFLVELEAFSCYGNCIWDALGIAAILKQNAHIRTACADCGVALELSVIDGSLQAARGIIHFALPARRWWDNIVFT
jgi:hypothetical protein